MRKLLSVILTTILAFTIIFSLGCNSQSDGELSLYTPDGAPALSVARLANDNTIINNLDINVVSANLITSFVTGKESKADFAILPVNVASKVLGSGENYILLGAVTHGNLFIMKKQSGVDISKENLSELVGKKVGVINLANVPGLTFKAILTDNNIQFVNIGENEYDANKVNLIGLSNGTEVIPNSECDYFVVPEPAATTKQNATGGKLAIAGSLVSLYGDGNGYPQAVLVAKKSVVKQNSKTVQKLLDSFDENKKWLTDENTTSETIVNAVVSAFVDQEMAPTFNANNLNATVINNCAINFVSAKDVKTNAKNYIAKLNVISNNAWGNMKDEFFYNS